MIKRRFIQGLLILALLCGAVLLAHPSAAWAMEGTGSKDDPYQISTAEDLYWFAGLVNDGQTTANAELTTDIDLNGSKSEQWTPIGNNTPYTGTFDGQRHTISGLSIDSDAQYVGLFSRIGSGGTVKNLTLSNSYIRISRSDSTAYVGGICGYNDGTIQNCCNSVKATATVTGSSICVGGICGYNNYSGSITSCSNSGTVTGSGSSVTGSGSTANVGGICGENWGSIENCSNSGPVEGSGSIATVGGICGYNDGGRITSCSNSCDVTGSGSVGGICGYNDGGRITNCSNSGSVEGSGSIATVGGICGRNSDGSISDCDNSGAVTGSDEVGGICGENWGRPFFIGSGSITNCSNSGPVTGIVAGGICGGNDVGNITSCSNSGPVSGSGDVGGICGWNDEGTITNCSNSGSVTGNIDVGGICGDNWDTITNCYWLDGTAEAGIGYDKGNGEATDKTADQYASGEVAWLLNQWQESNNLNGKVWAMGEDGYPVLNGKNDNIVVKLTFDANTGNVEDQPIIRYANAGAALPNVSLPEITGYSFTGWYEDVDCNGEQVTKIPDNATGEKTYYAKWTANTYTVTLNTNNGTIADGKEVTSYTYGTATMLPTEQDITHTGLNFGGWYDNAAFSGAPVTGITTTDFGDKTYYAKWTAEVTLNTNGGTVNSGNITDYTYGTETTLPTDVTRAGYTFAGWYEDEALSGEPETVIPDDATGAKTYYAKWTANTYTVTLNTNNGTINSGNVANYTYGIETTLPTDVTRAGYTFAGWYENEALSGEPETVIPADAMGAKEYWAKWTAKSYPSAPPTVSEEIQDAQPGETVTVDLSSGSTKLDKEVFETLAGKDVTLVVDLGDGVSWTVNGSDIPEDADFTDIDMGVTMGSDGIPVEVVNAMTFETATPIGSDGSVSLAFSHASQYAIVIDDHNHG
ncbi:MAG: InlB B-repeat-containing protein, partial [Peptococcaceae bacterium]|nr:InlB B-repeat-containing protein [Peptococcaceae bacterium]